MYSKIMVAVDLEHLPLLTKSLSVAGQMAQQFKAPIVYVSVGATFPTVTLSPHQLKGKLSEFAADEAKKYGIETSAHPIESVDPAAELDSLLLKAILETGSDLVIMGSHQPGFADYFFASNAGYVASHAPVSVMVVR